MQKLRDRHMAAVSGDPRNLDKTLPVVAKYVLMQGWRGTANVSSFIKLK